jgi:hypothetical protein
MEGRTQGKRRETRRKEGRLLRKKDQKVIAEGYSGRLQRKAIPKGCNGRKDTRREDEGKKEVYYGRKKGVIAEGYTTEGYNGRLQRKVAMEGRTETRTERRKVIMEGKKRKVTTEGYNGRL